MRAAAGKRNHYFIGCFRNALETAMVEHYGASVIGQSFDPEFQMSYAPLSPTSNSGRASLV